MVTRTIQIGKCTIVLNNVPPEVSEEELRKLAEQKLIQLSIQKAKKEVSKQYHYAG